MNSWDDDKMAAGPLMLKCAYFCAQSVNLISSKFYHLKFYINTKHIYLLDNLNHL